MKVTCKLCKFESKGACLKKKQGGQPKKIKLTKRRNCGLFQEDTMKVFTEFRKKEANKVKMRQVAVRRARMAAAIKAQNGHIDGK